MSRTSHVQPRSSRRSRLGVGQAELETKLEAPSAHGSERLLWVINHLQGMFIDEVKPELLFDVLLDELLDLSGSEYGFIGEVLQTAEQVPYLRSRAITNIAWDEETRALLARLSPNLEFRNLKTLFGAVMTTGQPVISNDPAHDPRAGGLPPGHPPMHAFLGLPFYRGENMIGMVGIANRPGGYDETLVRYLQPVLATCAQLLEGYRNRRLRHEAQEQLRRAQFAMDHAVDAVYWIDPQAKVLYTNEAASAMLGYTPDEFLRMTVHDLNPEFPPAKWPQLWEETRRKKILSFETVHLAKDGRRIPIDIRVSFLDLCGQEFHCAFVRDLTDRKQREEAQRRTQRLLSDVINTTPDLVFVKDRALRTILCNRVFAQALGKEPADLIGHTDIENGWDPVLVKGDPGRGIRGFEQDDREALGGRIVHNPNDLAHVNGAIRTFDTFKVPLEGDRGEVIGVLGIARDVTEQRRAEAERAERARQSELTAMVGAALNQIESVDEALNRCTEIIADVMGAPLVRIWTVEAGDRCDACPKAALCVNQRTCLHLRASAGVSKNLHGEYGRIPLGVLKIGRIAQGQGRMVTNDVLHDERLPNKIWMQEHGLQSFAGFPLVIEGQVYGVLALFGTSPFSDSMILTLEHICSLLAATIVRKRAEVASRETQERFELVVRGTNDGIWDWNVLNGTIYWSDRTFELLGFTPGEFTPSYEAWIALLHPDDADRSHAAVCRHLETRAPYNIELRVKRKDGSYGWFRDQGQGVWDAAGHPTRMVGSISDVTARKESDEALRALQAELEKRVVRRTAELMAANESLAMEIAERKRIESSLRELSLAQTHAMPGISRLDGGGRYTFANGLYAQMLGYEPEELMGRSWEPTVYPDDLPIVARAFEAMQSHGKGECEIRGVKKDGSVFYKHVVLVKADPATTTVSAAGHFCFTRDITDRKMMELKLQEHDLRERLLEEREQISCNLHDGLLQSIYAFRLNLERGRRLCATQPDKIPAYLDSQVRDMGLVIAEVRQFLEGQDPAWAVTSDFVEGLDALVQLHRAHSSVEWDLQVPTSVPKLASGDCRHLLYMVREAMSNVVRHAKAKRCRILVESSELGLRISIVDDGVGFEVREAQANGRGLRNLAARAQAMNVAMAITSSPGCGTRVTVDFGRKESHVDV